jgi:hypothetical protein
VRAVEKVFQAAHAGRSGPVMEDVRGVMNVGEFSYWLFVFAWFVLIGSLLSAAGTALQTSQPWTLSVLWSREGAAFATSLAAFASAIVLSDWANRRMTDAFTRFWHPHQQQLRKAMKDAHHRARMERKGVEHPAFRYY